MKKIWASLLLLSLFRSESQAQDNDLRQPSIGVSFFLNDFQTPQRIRSGGLSKVLREDNWASLGEMSSGLAITYATGLRRQMDFSATLAGSFVDYPLPNRQPGGDNFLLEADASVLFKLFSERYVFTPFASIGAGASKYKGYYAAFIPIGGGVKFNLFDEAAIQFSSQYRVPVTTNNASYHFMNSVTIFGVIGRKKAPETVTPM